MLDYNARVFPTMRVGGITYYDFVRFARMRSRRLLRWALRSAWALRPLRAVRVAIFHQGGETAICSYLADAIKRLESEKACDTSGLATANFGRVRRLIMRVYFTSACAWPGDSGCRICQVVKEHARRDRRAAKLNATGVPTRARRGFQPWHDPCLSGISAGFVQNLELDWYNPAYQSG